MFTMFKLFSMLKLFRSPPSLGTFTPKGSTCLVCLKCLKCLNVGGPPEAQTLEIILKIHVEALGLHMFKMFKTQIF